MINYSDVLIKVEHYVSNVYKQNHQKQLTYHNLNHTRNVVAAAEKIGGHYQLSEEDLFIVITAAWMHDIGYPYVKPEVHVQKSIELTSNFLSENLKDKELIDKIIKCIKATEMPQSPHNLLEEIVCDADLYHLGLPDFEKNARKLRKEVNNLCSQNITGSAWRITNIRLLENHNYFTDYCRVALQEGKQTNIEILKKKQLEKDEENSATNNVVETVKDRKKDEEIIKKTPK